MIISKNRFEWSRIDPCQEEQLIRSQLSTIKEGYSDFTESFVSSVLQKRKGILLNYEGSIDSLLQEHDIPFLKRCASLIVLFFVPPDSSLMTIDEMLRHIMNHTNYYCEFQFGFEIVDIPSETCRIEMLGA